MLINYTEGPNVGFTIDYVALDIEGIPPFYLKSTDYVRKTGSTMTGALEVMALRNTHLELDAASDGVTIELDFASNSARVLTLTDDPTFETVNLAAGRMVKVFIDPGEAERTPTFPEDWIWMSTAPTSFTASKWTILSLESKGTTDADVFAISVEQP
jgi:hypothetical protein